MVIHSIVQGIIGYGAWQGTNITPIIIGAPTVSSLILHIVGLDQWCPIFRSCSSPDKANSPGSISGLILDRPWALAHCCPAAKGFLSDWQPFLFLSFLFVYFLLQNSQCRCPLIEKGTVSFYFLVRKYLKI